MVYTHRVSEDKSEWPLMKEGSAEVEVGMPGIKWESWTGLTESLKWTEMKYVATNAKCLDAIQA